MFIAFDGTSVTQPQMKRLVVRFEIFDSSLKSYKNP